MARKELGQNFLKDPSLARQIVELARLDKQDLVLEIGPGLGAMTMFAAFQAHKVIAVEKDARIIPLLKAELLVHDIDNVAIEHQNILSVDLSELAAGEDRPLVVIGNLPYNISSQVLIHLMQARSRVSRAVLMFQKELADRLCAEPGNRTYGRITVMLQYCAEIKVLRHVRADMFFPKPKVDSVVLSIEFKTGLWPEAKDEALFGRVVQAAFGQRRKTLRNSLRAGFPDLDGVKVQHVLEDAGIDPKRRAETLSVGEFVGLTNTFEHHLS